MHNNRLQKIENTTWEDPKLEGMTKCETSEQRDGLVLLPLLCYPSRRQSIYNTCK